VCVCVCGGVCVCVCVCVCLRACVGERERERESALVRVCMRERVYPPVHTSFLTQPLSARLSIPPFLSCCHESVYLSPSLHNFNKFTFQQRFHKSLCEQNTLSSRCVTSLCVSLPLFTMCTQYTFQPKNIPLMYICVSCIHVLRTLHT